MEDLGMGLVAFDETSIDKYPAIYTLVSSDSVNDGRIRRPRKEVLSKKNVSRDEANNPPPFIDRIQYRWLQFDLVDKKRIQPYYRWGVIIGSLLEGEKIQEPLSVYVDGRMTRIAKKFAKDCIVDVTGIEKDLLHLYPGVDLDKRVIAVNYAHHLAFHLKHKDWKIDEYTNDPHRKHLLERLIPNNSKPKRKPRGSRKRR